MNEKGSKVDKTPISTENIQVSYTEPGGPDSPLFEGGFVLGYSDTQAEALNNNYLFDTGYLKVNWQSWTLEFLHLSPNTNEKYLALNYVKFTRSPAGIITGTFSTYAVRE